MRLDLSYIAGFLDFDGSVTIVEAKQKTKTMGIRSRFYPKVNFYNQNLAVVEEAKVVIGGSITPPNSGLDVFTLQLSPCESAAALRKLLPYLRVKREQAMVALMLVDQIAKTRRPGRSRVSDEVMAGRKALCDRIHALNHEDPKAFRAYRTNWVNSEEASGEEVTLSQAAEGKGPAEGATAREVSPNNNPLQERPARKGRHSLSSTEDATIPSNVLKFG